jgi:hypothetical protein
MDAFSWADLDGVVAACACHDSAATFDDGSNTMRGEFDGSISVRLGTPRRNGQERTSLPLAIIGYTTSSDVERLGRTTLDFDFGRPVRTSSLVSTGQDNVFPAVQQMRLHILMTAESMPGTTLRSMNQGTLANRDVRAFPPVPGSTYVLQRPVELEDISNPGVTRIRLVNVNTEIISSQLAPDEINAVSDLALFPSQGSDWTLDETRADTPVRFSLRRDGLVIVRILDRRGRQVATAHEGNLSAGEHTVSFDSRSLRGREYFYQIELDGQVRSARMLLIRR